MDFSGETIAELIIAVDPKANWVYNRYCQFCGRFIFPDNDKCKGCNRHASEAVLHPIPFLSSGTAIEKLIGWVRNKYNSNKDTYRIATVYRAILIEIAGILSEWLFARIDIVDVHQNVINAIGDTLTTNLETLKCPI